MKRRSARLPVPSLAGLTAGAVLFACLLASDVRAEEATFPKYDIAKACRMQADYVFAATLGQTDSDKEIAACSDRENEDMVLARTFWARASRKDAAECLTLADGRYGRLARCLDTSPSLRTAR